MLPKPLYGRSALALMPALAWIVPGSSWLMLRARSRCDAERPTYDTCVRSCQNSRRSTVAFHAHDVGLWRSGVCIAISSGKSRRSAPAGVSTLPLMTVRISDSGGLNPYAAVVLICTRFRNRPTPVLNVVLSLMAYATPSRG